jgi:hypothetical protein
VRTIVLGISGSFMIWCAYTVLPMSRLTRKLHLSVPERDQSLQKSPNRDDGGEKNQETEHVDIPWPTEPVQGNEDNREHERHSTKNLNESFSKDKAP